MADRTFENSEVIEESTNMNIPEVVDEMPDPALLSENASLIDKTIFFINRTISGKAIETALVIGGHILEKYFNDDIDAAFSKVSDKPVSFTMLCDHPDLRVSRQQLVDIVKVAAQERFFRSIDFNCGDLQYTHQLKLTRLPNDPIKIDMARECIDENLTTRQLDYRVRMQAMETESIDHELPVQNLSENAVIKLLAAMKQVARQTASLNIESIDPLLGNISGNTRTMLGKGLMALADEMDKTQIACETLSQKIRQMETEY